MANKKIASIEAKTNEKEAINMATNANEGTKIILKDAEGKEYTLEYNRRSVERMEKSGFKMDADYPATMIKQLFQGAFLMHHKGMTPDRVQEIWDAQTAKTELLTELTRLYMKPVNDLMEDPEGKENETPTWKSV